MDVYLTRSLIKKFTKHGDVILDPLGGVGTTAVEGILLGRDVILVDIEGKFVRLTRKNVQNVKRINRKSRFKLKLGNALIIQGDSRNLPELLKQSLQKKNADVIVTSPPYGHDSVVHKGRSGETPCAERKFGYADYYSDSPQNIGNLKHTRNSKVDAVITSPPFAEANRGGGIAQEGYEGKHGRDEKLHLRHDRPLSDNPDNISNLPFQPEVDSVITSPPFSEAEHHYKHGLKKLGKNFKGRKAWEQKQRSQLSPENIGSLKHGKNADVVITSPPYPEAYKSSSKSREEQAKRIPKKILGKNPKGGGARSLFTSEKNVAAKGFLEGMPPNPNNIGNLSYEKPVDVVITSPPYADGTKGKSRAPLWERLAKDPTSKRFGRKTHPHIGEGYSRSKQNIGNLPIGQPVDTVITSPPFSSSLRPNPKANKEKRIKKLKEVHKRNRALGKKWGISTEKALEREFERQDAGCGSDPQNIGTLPHGKVDTIITSPPYSSGIGHSLGANIGKTLPEHIRQSKSFKAKVALGRKHELIKHGCKGQIGAITEHGEVEDVIGGKKHAKQKS